MIEINNLTANPIGENFLKKIAEKVLKGENRKGIDLSIALVGEKRMKGLNRKYRKKNRPTDILAFGNKEVINLKLGVKEAAEIVICPAAVRKNSARFNSIFKKELARVLIHGILHLSGYDHERNARNAGKMNKKEAYYLNLFFK
jgi:probable rRNA maturation factor